MKNPVYEQIQARKVKARLRMLQHAQRISGNVSQTCRFFGVSRALYYIWKERYEQRGEAGLRDSLILPMRGMSLPPPCRVLKSCRTTRKVSPKGCGRPIFGISIPELALRIAHSRITKQFCGLASAFTQ